MKNILIQKYFIWFTLVCFTGNSAAQVFAPGACSLVPNSKTCVDATPCKTDVNGYQVCLAGVTPTTATGANTTKTCWQYSYQYSCAGSSLDINTCTTYETNSACSLTGSSCVSTNTLTAQCDQWQYTYQCQTQAATTGQQLNCGGTLTDALAMSAPTNANQSFVQAALAQEILNQGSTYTKGGRFFTGVAETCTKGWYGIKACCKTAPGGQSNSVMATIVFGNAASTIKYLGSVAIDWASPYVFDMMYNNGWGNSFTNCSNGTNLAASGFSLSAYGFTYSTVAPAAGSGAFGATTTIAGNSSTGYVSFNPYVFAAMVMIAVYQNLSSCTQDEQMLAMHKGSGLSAYIQEQCTNTNVSGCYITTEYYCSFNSVLAKIINIQGKTQLGLPLLDCQGLTGPQLGQIDFTKLDFSTFTSALVKNGQNNNPTSTAIKNGYTTPMSNTKSGSGQTGKSRVAPSY